MAKGQCFQCRYCDRYYVKEIKSFKKINLGWCCQNRYTVDIHAHCDKFLQKKKNIVNTKLLKHYLSDLLTEISEIRKIIEDENDV